MKLRFILIALFSTTCLSSIFASLYVDNEGDGSTGPPVYSFHRMAISDGGIMIQNGYLQQPFRGISVALSVDIFNESGVTIAQYNTDGNSDIYVGDLPKGNYVAVYSDEEGNTLNYTSFVIE